MAKMEEFVKGWNGKQEPSIADKIKEVFKAKEPLRHKLIMAQYKLRIILSRLGVYISKLQERDRTLFERVIEAQMNKDQARAAMYANEIAEIRKISRQLITTQIALEQVQLRLETVTELGDIFTNLVPVVGVIKELRQAMRGVMPELGLELQEIEEGLQEIVIEAGDFTGANIDYVASSPEAKKILQEAAIIAEQRMKENFPELPSMVTSTQKTAPTQK